MGKFLGGSDAGKLLFCSDIFFFLFPFCRISFNLTMGKIPFRLFLSLCSLKLCFSMLFCLSIFCNDIMNRHEMIMTQIFQDGLR